MRRHLYSAIVGVSCRLAWKMPQPQLVEMYRRNLSTGVHLDVGPGPGVLLAKTFVAGSRPRVLHLLDVNAEPLLATADRVAGLAEVRTHHQDALQPWPREAGAVDTVGCSLMLHTLPGSSFADKEMVVAEAARVLRPGGCFFGASIVTRGTRVRTNVLARRLLVFYNGKQVFSNRGDDADDLIALLRRHFPVVRTRVSGCTVVWEATR